jgi:peptide/nickel transport system substrate-binding protein
VRRRPWNCIYSAARLKEDPHYPETKILGTGAFSFVEHVKGQSWEGKRFEGYFQPGLPHIDGYKAFFVKSTGLADRDHRRTVRYRVSRSHARRPRPDR